MLLFKNKNFILYFLGVLVLSGCGVARVDKTASPKLRFLDEYIIPEDQEVDGTRVGGLSELDYDGEHFYAVCDLPSSPRIYRFSLHLKNKKIDTLTFSKVIKISKKQAKDSSLFFDSEGLLFNPETQRFTLSSEGSIKRGKDPFIVEMDKDGTVLDSYAIPNYFKASTEKGLRNNGVFEGLARSVDKPGIWVSTELPMEMDGPTAKIYTTKSPVRITYFDRAAKMPEKQFAYRLGRLRKLPFLPFGMNGVSGILEYKPERFFVIERAFSAGHGRRGCRVLIYQADTREATNTLNETNLRSKLEKSVTPASKKLLFDFNSVRKELTNRQIDNIEGICFGPKLPNGHQSLILIADNNFNSFTKQLNQVILMEVIPQ